jgi:hypothetical protein
LVNVPYVFEGGFGLRIRILIGVVLRISLQSISARCGQPTLMAIFLYAFFNLHCQYRPMRTKRGVHVLDIGRLWLNAKEVIELRIFYWHRGGVLSNVGCMSKQVGSKRILNRETKSTYPR